jgi:hypothetical protein
MYKLDSLLRKSLKVSRSNTRAYRTSIGKIQGDQPRKDPSSGELASFEVSTRAREPSYDPFEWVRSTLKQPG